MEIENRIESHIDNNEIGPLMRFLREYRQFAGLAMKMAIEKNNTEAIRQIYLSFDIHPAKMITFGTPREMVQFMIDITPVLKGKK